MGKVFKIVFYFGLLFFGGGLLLTFSRFVAYNGLGEMFRYEVADSSHIRGDTVSMPAKLIYSYSINGNEYADSQNVDIKTAKTANTTKYTVLYNTTFNGISMIGELEQRETKTWDQAVGMMVFGIPFFFILSIYLLSDKEKWIGVYSRGEYKRSRKD